MGSRTDNDCKLSTFVKVKRWPIAYHPQEENIHFRLRLMYQITIEMATTMLTQAINPFKYLLTYKLSQDHIEILFSSIRARGGWNNDPNSLRLMYTYTPKNAAQKFNQCVKECQLPDPRSALSCAYFTHKKARISLER